MLRTIRPLCAVVLLSCISPRAEGGGKGAGEDCPWWRPCGPGKTWGGNRLVPQSKSGVDFRTACQRHDDNYESMALSRKECDKQFLADMLALCEANGNPHGSRRRAKLSYIGVRLLGASSYGEVDER